MANECHWRSTGGSRRENVRNWTRTWPCATSAALAGRRSGRWIEFCPALHRLRLAPGFANRLAAKLARQQVLQGQRARRERIIAGIGLFAAGAVALALLVVPLILTAWTGISRLVAGTPTLLANTVEMVARWWVTFRALGEAGRSIIGVLAPSSGPIIAGYGVMLIVVVAAWVSMMRSASRRWNTTTLPVLVWL